MRILVVEDEIDLADAIARGLRMEGYAVDVAYSGTDALEKIDLHPYDLICLDLVLPGADGRTIARAVKSGRDGEVEPAPRILMLTAQGGVDARIAGLDDGADDYLVKPFDFGELLARVRALMRRGPGQTTSILKVGTLELDGAHFEARRGGRALSLSPKEFALLRYFMSREGVVLSQEDLLEHVWDENADPFTQTVRVTIMTLRKKLAPNGEPQPIETVVGRGYRLRTDA